MWDVHYDYLPPAPYDDLFSAGYDGPMTGENVAWSDDINPDMDPRDLHHLEALYDGEIRYTDRHVGDLFTLLKDLGVWDDTVTAVTADHGEEFLEHGRKTHRHTLYDEVLREPLVIRYPPRTPAGAEIDEQVRTMDIPVTLLSLAGLSRPASFGGADLRAPRDLTPLIRGEKTDGTPPIAVAHLGERLYGVRTGRHKFLVSDSNERELYDLAEDPGEQRNIVDDDPAVSGAPSAILENWLATEGRSLARPVDQSPEQLKRLRELGYIQ